MMSTTEMVRGRIGCLPARPRTAPPPEIRAIIPWVVCIWQESLALHSLTPDSPLPDLLFWLWSLFPAFLHTMTKFLKTCSRPKPTGASVTGFAPTGSCPFADGRSFGLLARFCNINSY